MPDFPQIPEITVGELADRLDEEVLIDVRQPDEYVTGHVRSAKLIPLNEVPDHVSALPSDREVAVICRTGSRSAMATEFLREQGIQAVNVAGGTLAWMDAGFEVVPGDQPA
jgi:rhodanese-related sulfurtransferase